MKTAQGFTSPATVNSAAVALLELRSQTETVPCCTLGFLQPHSCAMLTEHVKQPLSPTIAFV